MANFDPYNMPQDDGGRTPPPAPRQPHDPQEPYYQQQTNDQQPLYQQLTEEKKSVTSKLFRVLWISLGSLALLAAVALFFGNTLLARFAPRLALNRGITKTASAVSDRIADSPYQALRIFGNSIVSGSVSGEFFFHDSQSSGSGTVKLAADYENRNYSLGANLDVNNVQIDGELFWNKERAALRSSLLPDCYGITYKTFERDLRASALPEYTGMSEETILQLVDYVDQISSLDQYDLNSLITSYVTLYDNFINALDLDTSAEKVEIGGKKVSCSAISAKITEKEFRKLITDAVQTALDDETISHIMEMQLMTQRGLTDAEAKQEYSSQCNDIMRELENTLDQLSASMTYTWYLYDGQLVKISMDGDFAADNNTSSMACSMDLGCNPEKDDWLMALSASDGSDVLFSSEFSYASSSDADGYRDNLTIIIENQDDKTTASLQSNWDKSSGDLDFTLHSGSDTYRTSCNLIVDAETCKLSLKDFDGILPPGSSLELNLSADRTTTVESPTFVNLDRLDRDALDKIQAAIFRMGSALE